MVRAGWGCGSLFVYHPPAVSWLALCLPPRLCRCVKMLLDAGLDPAATNDGGERRRLHRFSLPFCGVQIL